MKKKLKQYWEANIPEQWRWKKKLQCQNQSKQKGPEQNPYPWEWNVKKAYHDIKNEIREAEVDEIKTVIGSQQSRALEIEKKLWCRNQSKPKGPKQNPYSREKNVKKACEDIKNKIIEAEDEEIKQ